MKGYIYKHTNRETGRVYIGQTYQHPETRWGKDGINYQGQRIFYRDIIRYGWDNFDHEIISIVEATNKRALKKSLDDLEIYYIKKYQSMSPEKGYNSTYKDSELSTRLTDRARRVISRKMKEGKTFEEAYAIYQNYKK